MSGGLSIHKLGIELHPGAEVVVMFEQAQTSE